MSIIRVTDLVSKSLESLNQADHATDPSVIGRREHRADTYAELATAQGIKTANIIAYLNSDRRSWSETDDAVVREMLGLPAIGGGEGGTDADLDVVEPVSPAPAAVEQPSVPVTPPAAPEPAAAPQAAPAPAYEPPVPVAASFDLDEMAELDFA